MIINMAKEKCPGQIKAFTRETFINRQYTAMGVTSGRMAAPTQAAGEPTRWKASAATPSPLGRLTKGNSAMT
jgi:hypothetical protein